MKINQVRCFCEVVDAGTLARAAERLHIAATAISMQIAQLEQEFGGELFDRRVKPMALTALGRFFLPRAREFIAAAERLEQDTQDVASGKQGWLGIGFVRSLIYSVVPAAVQSFRREHPEVKIELIELLTEVQPEQLRNDRIQIGLSRLVGPFEPQSGLHYTVLFDDPFVAAVPMDHPLGKCKAATFAQLDALPLISFPRDRTSGYASYVHSMLRDHGARPRIGHDAIEIHTALGLVAAGLGYAVVGASVASRGPQDVRFLTLPELKSGARIVAVSREGEMSAPAATMLATLQTLQLKRVDPAFRQRAGGHRPGRR
jgi:DNA-binding transcriptional LysR family regulator